MLWHVSFHLFSVCCEMYYVNKSYYYKIHDQDLKYLQAEQELCALQPHQSRYALSSPQVWRRLDIWTRYSSWL